MSASFGYPATSVGTLLIRRLPENVNRWYLWCNIVALVQNPMSSPARAATTMTRPKAEHRRLTRSSQEMPRATHREPGFRKWSCGCGRSGTRECRCRRWLAYGTNWMERFSGFGPAAASRRRSSLAGTTGPAAER